MVSVGDIKLVVREREGDKQKQTDIHNINWKKAQLECPTTVKNESHVE